MQQDEARQIPERLIEEGGVPVAHDPVRLLDAHAEEKVVEDLRAEGLPVEEVPPAANQLTDQQTQGHDVQIGRQLLLLELGEEQQPQNGADDAAVDGDAPLPDVEGGDGIVLVEIPAEDHVVDPGADNGRGHGEENGVRHQVKVGAEFLDPLFGVEDGQQKTQGDDQPVVVDLLAEDGEGQGPGRVDPLNPQPGEGYGTGVKIHSAASFRISAYYTTAAGEMLSFFRNFADLTSFS